MALQSPFASETPSSKLTEHRVLIFDVYGTLVDWESAIHDALVPVFPDLPRREILARYSVVEGSLQMQFPSMLYTRILELAYRQLTTPSGVTAAEGIADGETSRQAQGGPTANVAKMDDDPSIMLPPPSKDGASRFGRSIAGWKPFPDTIDALHRLKKHFALVVLSNVDDASFAGTHAQLCTPDYPGSAYPTIAPDSPFSLVLTAQQVGVYKPDPMMLESALRQLSADPDPSLPWHPGVRVESSRVLVVANSIRHDIVPATRRGLRSVWISRHGVNYIGNERGVAVDYMKQEGGAVDSRCGYTWRYETLGRMAVAVKAEMQK